MKDNFKKTMKHLLKRIAKETDPGKLMNLTQAAFNLANARGSYLNQE